MKTNELTNQTIKCWWLPIGSIRMMFNRISTDPSYDMLFYVNKADYRNNGMYVMNLESCMRACGDTDTISKMFDYLREGSK